MDFEDKVCHLIHRNQVVTEVYWNEVSKKYHFPILIGVIDGHEYQILDIMVLKFTHAQTSFRRKDCSICVPETNTQGGIYLSYGKLIGITYTIYINPTLQWSHITQSEIDEIFDDIFVATYSKGGAYRPEKTKYNLKPMIWMYDHEYIVDGGRYILDYPQGLLMPTYDSGYEFCALKLRPPKDGEYWTDDKPEGARYFSYLTLVGRSEAEILNRIDGIRLRGKFHYNPKLAAYQESIKGYEERPLRLLYGTLIFIALMIGVSIFKAMLIGWGFLILFYILWLRAQPEFWLLWYSIVGGTEVRDVDEEVPFEKPRLFREEIILPQQKDNDEKTGL